MRLAIVAAALFAAVLCDAAKKKKQEGENAESAVITLTDENFDAEVEKYDTLLVAFVAPWCGHCKKLKPEFAEASKILAPQGLHLASVDATASKEIAERFNVQGYPTLKFHKKGSGWSDYNGGRDAESIVQWVKRKSGPSATEITSYEQFDTLVDSSDVLFAAFVSSKDSAFAGEFTKAADALEETTFVYIPEGEVANMIRGKLEIGAAGEEGIVTINDFKGEENLIYAAANTFGEDKTTVSQWASSHALPLVITFSPETSAKIFRGDIRTHFLVFADLDSDSEAQQNAVAEFRAAAKTLAGSKRLLFVHVPPKEDRVLGYFGITKDQFPTAVLINMAQGTPKKYMWIADKELTSANFLEFIADYEAGKIKPFLKSEPAPNAEENAAAAVKVVTGSNFEDVVIHSDKDVLLEIYAPWCGHCKSLAPIYESLGQGIKAHGVDIVIAKMDGTANEVDHPGVNVQGFPTLLFFPAGAKDAPVDYDGERTLAGFVSFFKKRATNGFELTEEDFEEKENDEL